MCEIFTIRTIHYQLDCTANYVGYCTKDIINIKENIDLSYKYLTMINEILKLKELIITEEGILQFSLQDTRLNSELCNKFNKFTQKYNIQLQNVNIIKFDRSCINKYFTQYEINKEIKLNLEFNNINSKLSKLEIENSKSNESIKLLLNKVDELEKNNKLLNEKVRNCEIEIHYLKSTIQNKNIKYNYEEIRNRNKKLNSDFKKVYRLISKKY